MEIMKEIKKTVFNYRRQILMCQSRLIMSQGEWYTYFY